MPYFLNEKYVFQLVAWLKTVQDSGHNIGFLKLIPNSPKSPKADRRKMRLRQPQRPSPAELVGNIETVEKMDRG